VVAVLILIIVARFRALVVAAVVAVLFSVTVAGCGSTETEASRHTSAGGEASAQAATRVERCTDRFLERVDPQDFANTTEAEIRRYVEISYCLRFEKQGWVYDDGTLSIDAYTKLVESGSEECTQAESGEEARTVPCEELDQGDAPQVLDCAILHHVRRAEVRKYVRELRRSREVTCDDGTPLHKVGAV
jgi:hypothetical protein